MKRKFSNREKILLLVLAILLVICLYYLAVDQPTVNAIEDANARRDAALDEINIKTLTLSKMIKMQKALEALDENEKITVPDFNNLNDLTDFLFKEALIETKDYSLTFPKLERAGKIVRRTVNISFSTDNYESAKKVLETIYLGPYRCEVTTLSINRSSIKDSILNGDVNVKMTVVFFEFDASPAEATSK